MEYKSNNFHYLEKQIFTCYLPSVFCRWRSFNKFHFLHMDQFLGISNTSTLYLSLAFSAREELLSSAVGRVGDAILLTHFFCDRVRFGRSRSFKVIQGRWFTNRKRVWDFLLVINSNYGPILHRFWDTVTYLLKIAYFSYPSLIWRPRSLCSVWNFAAKLTMRQLESWGYPTVKTMIVAWVVLTQCQRVTDRQTDGQTDWFTIASSALCIASYADAL